MKGCARNCLLLLLGWGVAAYVAGQLRGRMIRYFIGVVVCGGLGYGIVRLYHDQAATLPL